MQTLLSFSWEFPSHTLIPTFPLKTKIQHLVPEQIMGEYELRCNLNFALFL